MASGHAEAQLCRFEGNILNSIGRGINLCHLWASIIQWAICDAFSIGFCAQHGSAIRLYTQRCFVMYICASYSRHF